MCDPVHLFGLLVLDVLVLLAVVAAMVALLLSAIRRFNETNVIATLIALGGGALSIWAFWGTRAAFVGGWAFFAGAVSLWANIRREEGHFLTRIKKTQSDPSADAQSNRKRNGL